MLKDQILCNSKEFFPAPQAPKISLLISNHFLQPSFSYFLCNTRYCFYYFLTYSLTVSVDSLLGKIRNFPTLGLLPTNY